MWPLARRALSRSVFLASGHGGKALPCPEARPDGPAPGCRRSRPCGRHASQWYVAQAPLDPLPVPRGAAVGRLPGARSAVLRPGYCPPALCVDVDDGRTADHALDELAVPPTEAVRTMATQ